jgi:hypothetical protein
VTFAIKDNYHGRGRGYRHKHWCTVGYPDDFKFCKIQNVSLAAAKFKTVDHIRGLLGDHPISKIPTSQYKNTKKVVFMFFCKCNDLKWLASLGFILQTQFPYAEIADLQTESIATTIARNKGKNLCGAKDLYDTLGFTVHGLHCGGNDAYFQLRAHLASLVLTENPTNTLTDCGYITPLLQISAPPPKPMAVPARGVARVARATADESNLVLKLTNFNVKDAVARDSTLAGNTVLKNKTESQKVAPNEQATKAAKPLTEW